MATAYKNLQNLMKSVNKCEKLLYKSLIEFDKMTTVAKAGSRDPEFGHYFDVTIALLDDKFNEVDAALASIQEIHTTAEKLHDGDMDSETAARNVSQWIPF